jgi:hypothetical protein
LKTFEERRVFESQAKATSVPDDDVIEHWDAQRLSSLDETPSQIDVVWAGFWIPGGMVVCHNQTGNVREDGTLENFARVHFDAGNRPFSNFFDTLNTIIDTQMDRVEVFAIGSLC